MELSRRHRNRPGEIRNGADGSFANVPFQEIRFTSVFGRADSAPVMDIFWSIGCVPIGIALALVPAAVVWWLVDRKKPGPDDSPKA
jgi:hypothetical protein